MRSSAHLHYVSGCMRGGKLQATFGSAHLYYISGCMRDGKLQATFGSALALGACDRLGVQPRAKTSKSLVNIDFIAHLRK